jgi:hypothetical protein
MSFVYLLLENQHFPSVHRVLLLLVLDHEEMLSGKQSRIIPTAFALVS